MAVDLETADSPNLPAAPPGSTCTLIQRGHVGNAQDTDIGLGNGANYPMGTYPFSWTGVSPNVHWSTYQFDMSVVPAGSQVVLAVFSVYSSWNMDSSTVRAHRIKNAWNEATATWANFGGNAAWDPSVLGSFNPNGGGFQSVNVTGLAQDWHSGAVANNGLLLEEDPVKLHSYFSSEVGTQDRRPSLWVCWGEPPPPACEPVGAECSSNADCCDGVPCNGGTCHFIICGSAGASCNVDADCCAGNTCNAGHCGTPPPVCANPGQACGGAVGCCNGAICNDGVCPGGGGGGPVCADPGQACGGAVGCCNGAICNDGVCPGGGGGECSSVGGACNADADCCNGSCQDGACTDVNQCVQTDATDADGNLIGCDAAHPCCDGTHCMNFGNEVMQCAGDPSITCVLPGQACDPFNNDCCWGLACVDGACSAL